MSEPTSDYPRPLPGRSEVTSEIPRIDDEPPAPLPPAPEPEPDAAAAPATIGSSVSFAKPMSLPASPYAAADTPPLASPYAASDSTATVGLPPVPDEPIPGPQADGGASGPAMRYFASDPIANVATATLTAEPGAAMPDAERESVTCPECGTVATVALTRRESSDFCRSCDYPLFWTPSKVVLDRSGLSDDSLRRLPGTVGRVAVASFPCPHCAELNAVSAVTCVRCGQPLHPVRVEAPAPVYIAPPPPPVYEEEPERGTPLWVWLLVGLVIVATVTLVVLYLTNTIG